MRTTREQETRAATEGMVHPPHVESWEPAEMLSTKHIPAKEGYVRRWVRTSTKGYDDQSNVYKKAAKHWRPVLASSVPKGLFVPSMKYRDADVIGFGSTILMERPIGIDQQEKAFIKQQGDHLSSAGRASINEIGNVTDRRYVTDPSFKNRSEVIKGSGRPPDIDD